MVNDLYKYIIAVLKFSEKFNTFWGKNQFVSIKIKQFYLYNYPLKLEYFGSN